MVERYGPSRKSMLKDVLTQSIGNGLSDFTNSYYANKALEGVINDKSNASKPYSERIGALQTALNPFGQKGAEILQQRLGVEEMRQKEGVMKEVKQLETEKRKGISKLAQQHGFSEDEAKGFETAKEVFDAYKAKNPQPKGGVSAQPIQPAHLDIMNQIDSSNPTATPAQKAKLYANSSIPESSYKTRLELEQEEAKPGIYETEATKAQAKADIEYGNSIQEKGAESRSKTQGLLKAKNLVNESGGGSLTDQALEKIGLIKFTSANRRELAALKKGQMRDLKTILGSQFSTVEFQTIEKSYFNENYGKDANLAIINNQLAIEALVQRESEVAAELLEESGGKPIPNYQAKVNQRLMKDAQPLVAQMKADNATIVRDPAYLKDEYNFTLTPGNVLMFTPDGRPMDVPPKDVEVAKEKGAQVI